MANSLAIRTISGSIYVAVIVLCILGGPFWVKSLSTLFAVLAGIELTKITVGLPRRRTPAVILDIAGLMILAFGPSLGLAPLWAAVIVARIVFELYLKNDNPIRSLAMSFAMQVYIGLPFFLMSGVTLASQAGVVNENVLLAIFIMIWINDTGAFLIGSWLGRHKLFERLSPKKTFEGFLGGLGFNIIAAVCFALFCPAFFGLSGSLATWLGLAIVITVFSTWGDLAESMIKRTLMIKDSGNLIPGHGGILDRIDSFLLVMPASAIYLYYVLF